MFASGFLAIGYGETKQESLKQRVEKLLLAIEFNEKIGIVKGMGEESVPVIIEIFKENQRACIPSSFNQKGCLRFYRSTILFAALNITKAADLVQSVLLDPKNKEITDFFKENMLRTLGKIGNREHLPSIIKFITYENSNDTQLKGKSVRMNAVEAIGNLGDERELSLLEKIFKKDPSKSVHGAAEKAIQKIKQRKKQK